jgi:hypothetical protein
MTYLLLFYAHTADGDSLNFEVLRCWKAATLREMNKRNKIEIVARKDHLPVWTRGLASDQLFRAAAC